MQQGAAPSRLALVVLLTLLTRADADREEKLRIAGVFENTDPPEVRAAFHSSIDTINRQTMDMKVFSGLERPYLTPVVVTVEGGDGFRTARTVCGLMERGVVGVVGPRQSASTDIVRSVCDRLGIPQLVTNWDPSPALSDSFQVNLYPESGLLSQALVDVLKELHWRTYTVLYEGDESLVRLRGVLQEREPWEPNIAVRQLSPDGDHRALLKEIRLSGETRLVLDAADEKVLQVMRQAEEVKLMGIYHSFFVTSLDAVSPELAHLRAGGANVTVLRLTKPPQNLHDPPASLENSTTGEALVVDAVQMLSSALFQQHSMRPLKTPRLQCVGDGWSRGPALRQELHNMPYEGESGSIALDSRGRRVDFLLEALELSAAGFRRVGTWAPSQGFVSTRSQKEVLEEEQTILQGRHLIVSSRIGAPYLSEKKPTTPPREGNDRYEGYSMDLIARIAELLNFTFEFQLACDGEYGKPDDKGVWNGIVGDLIAGRADLGICDLTITQLRQSVVDFTMPFMNLGISILYKKAEKADPNLFAFMDPFTADVWIYVATAFLAVSLIFYIVARIAPGEWVKSNPRDPDCDELENQFSMGNILWFTGSALLGGGGEELPRVFSTRTMAGAWAFFKMIMVASYTANLAAFLTNSRMESSINGVEDLAKQNKIKYGTYGKGSTADFFKYSNDSLYSRMYTVMKQARPDVFTNGNAEGVERVIKEKGRYAFFMESTSIEYQTALNCSLRKVGGQLDSKGYGIALPRDSPFRTPISGAVLTLQERGDLIELKNLWWKAPEGKECPKEEVHDASASAELNIMDVGGVFLVVGLGLILAMGVNVAEFLWNCRKIAVEERITQCEAFRSEVKLVSRLWSDVKHVRKKRPPEQPDVCQAAK